MKKILEFIKWFAIMFVSGPIAFLLIMTILSPLNPWGSSYPDELTGLYTETWHYFLNLIKHPFNWYVALVALLASGVFFRKTK